MKNVRLLQVWGKHQTGELVGVPDLIGDNLVKNGLAIDPNAPSIEPTAKIAAKAAKKAKAPKPKVKKAKARRKQ